MRFKAENMKTTADMKDKRIKLLVVDDDEFVIKIYKAILPSTYNIKVANTGVEALEMLQTYVPDIVLMDVLMPELNGLDVCRILRKDLRHKFTKVILVSAMTSSEERMKGYEAGADDYITKPFVNEEIVAKLGVYSKLKFTEESDQILRREKKEQQSLIRKLQITQEQLMQSGKLASIGQLAAGVAHEINNPIGYVGSNLSTLRNYLQDLFKLIGSYEMFDFPHNTVEEFDDLRSTILSMKEKINIPYLKKDISDLLDESDEGIQRVRMIVRDLKSFSHIDNDEWEDVDLHEGIESTLNIVNNEIKYKARIEKEYGKLPKIECISSRINQVFMNILVNAAHAIENNGVIHIRTGVDGSNVWVEISDNGCGIKEENLGKIFDPFYTSKPVGKGTGLGLSLSYRIIKKHDGYIEVDSETGKGTSFRIWLPMERNNEGTENINLTSLQEEYLKNNKVAL